MERKELDGFYDETELSRMLYDGEITRLEFIRHHSEEWVESFLAFCKERNLEENDEAARLYFEWRLEEENAAHTEGLD